jgi:dTDP-glucose 4,6-dehydratase
MRVLVTGGSGFVAHHVINKIVRDTDWEIVVIDRSDRTKELNRLAYILNHEISSIEQKRIKIINHDLKNDFSPIDSQIGKLDYIFHIAASADVDLSIREPTGAIVNNVLASVNLLNYARTQENLKRFFNFSSGEVFGPAPGNIKYKDNDRYNSANPYSASKAAVEEIAVSYFNSYNLPVVITHTMNIFGERQHQARYIPSSIRKIRNDEVVMIHGNKDKTMPGSRQYLHAEDVAEAVLFLTKFNDFGETWGGARCPKFNVAGTQDLNNFELAEYIAEALNKTLKYEMVDFHSSRPGHELRYSLDTTKILNLGWKPKPIKERVQRVVDWFSTNPEWL